MQEYVYGCVYAFGSIGVAVVAMLSIGLSWEYLRNRRERHKQLKNAILNSQWKLSVTDIGEVGKSADGTYAKHQGMCEWRLRLARTPEGRTVRYCPACILVFDHNVVPFQPRQRTLAVVRPDPTSPGAA